jgi:ribosomal protein S12 methylthiotransferase
MVGFPGETNDDFQKLLDFLEKAKFDRLGCFIYSDEEGTVSSSMKRKVSERIARERYENLLIFQSQIAYERLKRFVGKNLNVLIEQENKLLYVARSHLDAPEVDGEVTVKKTREIDIPGYYTVRITDSDEYDLKGELI